VSTYEALKQLHLSCVVLSGTGFALRGALALAGSPILGARVVRIAPHLVDTLLLASAVGMALLARLWPPAHPWLAAKIGGLAVYIVLGALALRPGRSTTARAAAFAGALLVFAYVVGTALQRDPYWPLR